MSETRPSSWPPAPWAGALAVAAAALLPLAPGLGAASALSRVGQPGSFWGFEGGLFMPLTWLSRLPGHEWTLNWLLHAAASALVFSAARAFIGLTEARRSELGELCALAAGLLFAASPLRSETVLGDAGRPAILAAIFALASFLSYLRYREAPESRVWIWAALGSYALSCLAWTGALALPLVFAALDRWRPGRAGRPQWPNPLAAPTWAASTFAVLAYVALVYAMNGHYLAAPPRLPHWSAGFELSRLAASLAQTAGQILLPRAPDLNGAFLPGTGPAVVAGLLLILAAPLAAWRWRGPGAWVAACLAVYAGAFFAAWDPASLVAQTDAARASYLPAALLLVAAPALAPWLETAGLKARQAAGVVAALLLLLGARASLSAALALRQPGVSLESQRQQAALDAAKTLAQSGRLDAEDAQAVAGAAAAAGGQAGLELFQQAAALDPDNWTTHLNFALALNAAGRVDEALAQMREAVRANPSAAVARNDYGFFLMQRGRLPEAIEQLTEAVRLDPNMALAQNNLAAAQAARVGQLPAAERARRSQALLNEGVQAISRGQQLQGIEKLSQAALLDPGNPAIPFDTGVAYVQLGRFDQGEAAFRRAVALQPNSTQAHFNLGFCLHQQGRLDEAVAEYREAIRCDPKAANAYLNAGVALTAQNKLAEAEQFCSQAARLDPNGAGNNPHCYRKR